MRHAPGAGYRMAQMDAATPKTPDNFFRATRYIGCATTPRACPADDGAEVVFAGRSNAGKSSAINAICDRRNLARTSKTPGRTRALHFFEVAPGLRIVDLPGYGYARVAAGLRQDWAAWITRYFETRRSLRGAVIVMDARRPLTAQDEQAVDYLRELPLHILLTKSDKLKRAEADAVLRDVQGALAGAGISVQTFSTLKKHGLGEARVKLAGWLGGG